MLAEWPSANLGDIKSDRCRTVPGFSAHVGEAADEPSTVGAIDYGVELVSTGGADATFEVNEFSLTTS